MRIAAAFIVIGCLFAHSTRADGFVTTSDGVRIHYVERVPPEPASDLVFVLVPGWMMPATIWSQQLSGLGSKYRVVAMDPRSQGDSEKCTDGHYPARKARDLRELLEQRNLRRVLLVATASGVTDAAAYVDQFGTDRLAGLVLVHGVAGADYDSTAVLNLVRWAHRFQRDRGTQTEALVRSLFVTNPPPDQEIARLSREAMKMPTHSAMSAFLGSLAADYRPALAKIDKPAWIVVGESRWHEQYEAMHGMIAGSRLKKIKGAGHGLYLEAAGEFNQLLTEFAGELETSVHDRQ